MREEGTVVGVSGRLVRVRMKPGPQCGSCCACSALGGGPAEVELESDRPLEVGARVIVEIAQGDAWLSALLLFVLPLAGLVSGVIAGQAWWGGGAAPLVLGFGLLGAFYALAAAIDRAFIRKRLKPPTIAQVLGPDDPQCCTAER